MRIDVDPTLVARAQQGELAALDAVLRQIQTPLYGMALRMLGPRDDAQDATQEILPKVTSHLGGWRGERAASVMRACPEYAAPGAMMQATRLAIRHRPMLRP